MSKTHIDICEKILFFLSFTCLIPLLFIFSIGSSHIRYWGMLLAFATVVMSTVAMIFNDNKKGPRILTLTFWLYVYIFIGLTPMIQFYHGSMPWPGYYSNDIIIKTYMIIILGLFCYQLGFSTISASGQWAKIHFFENRFKTIASRLLNRKISEKRTLYLLYFSISVIFCMVLIVGNSRIFIYPRAVKSELLMNIIPGEGVALYLIFNTILCVPIFISSFLLYVIWKKNKAVNKEIKAGFKIAFIISIIANCIINNPVSTPRYFVGTIFLSFLFVFINWKRRSTYLRICACLIVLFIVIFPFSDIFRDSLIANLPETFSKDTISKEFIGKGDFDSLQQLLNGTLYVEEMGIAYGEQIAGTILFWVPRYLWIEKPIATGTLVAKHMGYQFTNISFPIWGEIYIDFGWFGIIIFFSIMGMLSKKLEEIYAAASETKVGFPRVMIIVLSSYQIFILRGALISSFAYFAPIVLTLFLVSKYFPEIKH